MLAPLNATSHRSTSHRSTSHRSTSHRSTSHRTAPLLQLDEVDSILARIAGPEESSYPVLTLVGNKVGGEVPRQVSHDEAVAFADERGMDYLETDALSGLRAREPFQSTFLSVVNEIPQLPEPSALLRKGIKLGTKLLANRKFLGALYGLGTFRESTGAPRKERRRKRKPEKVERRPFPDEGASREVLLAWIQTELHWRQCGSSRLMGLMDEDRSGAATFNEFTQGLNAAGVAELKRGDAMRLFKAIDISGNLSISIAELTQTLFTRNYNEEPEEKEAVDPWGDGPRPEVLENPLKGVHPSYPNAPTRRPAGESKHGPSPLEARSKGGRPRRQQGPARPSAVARENAKTETRGGRGGGARVGSMADFPPTFWEDLGRKLPTARDPATRKRRMDMFSAFDPNGNGYLSLAEVDRGITQALDCQQLFDAKPVIMRAFQAAKYAHSTKSKLGADYVERIEFRLLLVYLRRYFELFVMFDAIDGDDRRIDRGEFLAALPKIAEWGVTLADAGAEFDSIDTNGGGSILFDEFCAWALAKELDLVEDDDAEEDQDVDVPLVSSASAARAGAAATRAALNRSTEGGEGKINRDAGPAMTNEEWTRLGEKLPTGKDPATRKRRMDMFSAFDPNGNGYLSLAEVDRGITQALDCQQLFDAKPVIMRAFQAAKYAHSTKSKLGADYVERIEFRLLLVYLRRYFELFVMFDAIDGDDRRIDRGEFSTALSKIAEWGVVVADAGAEFDSIDTNGGGSILFDEFCAWALAKELDLVEDDDAEEDQDVDVPLVTSAEGSRG